MMIKSFIVESADKAEDLIHEKMGPNAVILTLRRAKENGHLLEVVAAVDENDFHAYQELIGHEEGLVKDMDFSQVLNRIKLDLSQKFLPQTSDRKTQHEQISPAGHEEKKNPPDIEFLLDKGADASVAKELHLKLLMRLLSYDAQNPEAFFNSMKKEIASMIMTTGPICLSKEGPTIIALVGPSGVGKTTMLVKIALEYIYELNKRAILLSIDQHTIGAFEQSFILTNHFNVPFERARTQAELAEAIKACQDFDLILIDTCGCSPFQTELMDETEEILSVVDNLQVHLALSATTKDIDAMAIVKQFGRFLPESLMITKIDETLSLGLLLNLCHHTRMAISYLSNGPYIPQNLKVADPGEIAHDFLIDRSGTFQRLSPNIPDEIGT